jgi:hypothetical protein
MWPLMRDFRFGVVLDGFRAERAPGAPGGLLACGGDGRRHMDCAAHSGEQ